MSGNDNRNQILLAKSTDGGATFSTPCKVSDYYDLPDCDTYQGAGADSFRACVPEKGSSTVSVFRATNYASGAVNPKNPNQVAVTVGSYINKHSNESNGCVPAGFAAVPGSTPTPASRRRGRATTRSCSASPTTAVRRFTGGATDPRDETIVNQDPGQAKTDQFWQWAAFTKDGKLAVDYYDRQYGSDETTGCVGLLAVRQQGPREVRQQARHDVVDAAADAVRRPARRPVLRGLHLAGTAGNDALPIWSDTRDPDLFLCPGTGTPRHPPALCTGTEETGVKANDENTYMARMAVPTK